MNATGITSSQQQQLARLVVCPASGLLRQTGRIAEGSDCLAGEAEICCHERLSRNVALRIVMSLRATATRAMSLGFPAATSLSRKLLSCGLQRAATMAPTNSELRTLLRPPPMKLLPRHCPDWRVQGASPTRAAICRRLSEPSSGSSAIRVRAIVFPTPGTEARRSSFSAQTGDPRLSRS